jgi:hypothetical protein
VAALVHIGEASGEMRAAPISYYRRKELEASARRERILWVVGDRTVKPAEVDAVLRGARLPDRREPAAHAIRRASVVESALEHFVMGHSRSRLTPEQAMAYVNALRAMPTNFDHWFAYSQRERAKLFDMHQRTTAAPPAVKALFEWADADPHVSSSAVLCAATLYWGLSRLFPEWRSVSVVIHHELRVGLVDWHGLLVLTDASEAQRDLLRAPASVEPAGDGVDLTTYFERFTFALGRALRERLAEIGRIQDLEAHLPWEVIAPPDALDARLYETVERLGQAGSAAIVAALGNEAPPLRTVQRRLQKLVSNGVLRKRGARKNAIYALAEGDEPSDG